MDAVVRRSPPSFRVPAGRRHRRHRLLEGLSTIGLLLVLVFFGPAANAQAFCANPGADPGGVVGGIVNTYYAGNGDLSVGATSLTLGTRNTDGSSTNVAVGDLLLIIQMQDGVIDASNSAN